MRTSGNKRRKEVDRQRKREAKLTAAGEKKAARQRAVELGMVVSGSGPEMGEAQEPLDPVIQNKETPPKP